MVQSGASEESLRTELEENDELKEPFSSDGRKPSPGEELEDLFFTTLLTKLSVIGGMSKGINSS